MPKTPLNNDKIGKSSEPKSIFFMMETEKLVILLQKLVIKGYVAILMGCFIKKILTIFVRWREH